MAKPLESQLFSYRDGDEEDTGIFIYHECVLKQDVGTFKAGHFFSRIVLDYNNSTLRLYKHGITKKFYKFDLLLKVKKRAVKRKSDNKRKSDKKVSVLGSGEPRSTKRTSKHKRIRSKGKKNSNGAGGDKVV